MTIRLAHSPRSAPRCLHDGIFAAVTCSATVGSRGRDGGDGVSGMGKGAGGRELTYRVMFLACAAQVRRQRH